MPSAPVTAADAAEVTARRATNLALVFQEILTVTVRLRSNRQSVPDAEVFRNQIRHALKAADRDAKSLGYTDEDIRLGVFAVVAFLDETILNLHNPVFADWVRRPLQEELFGRHVAGEVFFENLQHILGRRDKPDTADVLEVYQLCILLGYLGRYSVAGRGELRALMGAVADKIARIRGVHSELSPAWRIPGQAAVYQPGDRWVRRLGWAAGGCAVLTVIVFLLYWTLLESGASSLRSLAQQLPGY